MDSHQRDEAFPNGTTTGRGGTVPRGSLRLSAAVTLAGVLLSGAVGVFHPDTAPANDHPAAFVEYARSEAWTAVHLGQFLGMALLLAGVIAVFRTAGVRGGAGWAARAGEVAAIVALALHGALQAVDGVALKQAVDAWDAAPGAEKAERFAVAEGIRWLEWGLRSYQSLVLGAALVLLGAVIAQARRGFRLIGSVVVLSGVAFLVQGWVIGAEGFSATNTAPTLAGIALTLLWSTWLLVSAWRG